MFRNIIQFFDIIIQDILSLPYSYSIVNAIIESMIESNIYGNDFP